MMDNPVVYKDAETLAIWVHMLLLATHDTREETFRGERITLHKGQFLSSVRLISDKLHIDKSKTQRVITSFKNETQIETQESNKNTLFTIKNWASYQSRDTQDDTQVRHEDKKSETQNKNESEECKNNIYIVSDETISRTGDQEQKAIDAWNEVAKETGLPIVTKLAQGTKRANMLTARINQYGVDDVILAIRRIRDSKFLQGQNRNGWSISLDWLVKPNNFPKVLEGNYDDKKHMGGRLDAIESW